MSSLRKKAQHFLQLKHLILAKISCGKSDIKRHTDTAYIRVFASFIWLIFQYFFYGHFKKPA